MKKFKYSLIFCLIFAAIWKFWPEAPSNEFGTFKKDFSESEKLENKKLSKIALKSKKDLLYKSRTPAQVRRNADPVVQDFFNQRSDEENRRPKPPAKEYLTGIEINSETQKGYVFLDKTRAFKLSSEIQNRYPHGHQHLGFWIANDESFQADADLGLDVVYNSKHQTYGVVTGVLKIEFKDLRDESDFEVLTRGEVFKRYDYISTVFFKYQKKDALLEAQRACAERSGLSLCEIEILEFGRYAR